MLANAPDDLQIDLLIEKLINTASNIRQQIDNLDFSSRRKRTVETAKFSNQFEIDVLADEIVHRDFVDFDGYIVSEERELDKAKMESNELLLVVDPIDGSTNASRSIGYWCFSAAIVFKGKVIAGVVVDQVSKNIFTAKENSEAVMITKDGSKIVLSEHLGLKRQVGNRADNFSSSVICFNSHEGPSIPFRHLRHFGSSALAICDVARGGFDAYIDDEDVLLRPWDILAAEFIAKAAGCEVFRRDSAGLMAATGVMVTRSAQLTKEFRSLFPHFFV